MSSEGHWQQEHSLALIEALDLWKDAAVVDVGGGASHLARELLGAGYRDITVADLSAAALEQGQEGMGEQASEINLVVADVP